jgi:hypothetical protein
MFHVEAMPVDRPPIVDYWALSLHHVETTLADIFCSIFLEQQRPRVILCLSAKVHQILSEGRLVLSADTADSDVNDLIMQTASSTLKACRKISQTKKKEADSLNKIKDPGVISKIEAKEEDADEILDDPMDVKLMGSPLAKVEIDELEDEDQPTQTQKVEVEQTDDLEIKDVKIKLEEDDDDLEQETDSDAGKLELSRKMKVSSSNSTYPFTDDFERGSTPGASEFGSDDIDHDDGDDNNDFPEWSELQEAGFTELMGTLHAVEYGKSRWAISVPMLHPGFYK